MKIIQLQSKKVLSSKEVVGKLLAKIYLRTIKNKRILIVCEDITRSMPIHVFFPAFVQKLKQHTKNISVLFALGTHRPMTEEEMLTKLGMNKMETTKIKLINHNAFDNNQLIEVGKIDDVALKINKIVSESNIIITMGSVIPHRVMGFSGGGKILCPGIGNKEFIDYTHWKSNFYKEEDVMGKINNPMRRLMDKQADLIQKKFPKIKFISVNFVTVPNGIVEAFIGTFKDSYKKAALLSSKIFIKRINKCSKILTIVDDKCVDFWQAAKAVYNCARILEDGGQIVVQGKLKEGISSTHGGDIKKFGYSTPEKIQNLFEEKQLTNQVAASHMVRVSQHLKRVRIILSSENLDEKTCKEVNLEYLHPQEIKMEEYDLVVYSPVDLVLTA